MAPASQMKRQALRYAVSLQMVVRNAIVFSINHPSVQPPLQNSFDLLNKLLKESGQVTIGFTEKGVVLNQLLTPEHNLRQLENELLKRGMCGVRFEPGMTLAAYKRLINLLSTPVAAIEEAGGAKMFLDQNPVEGAMIYLAGKNQSRNLEGDTILESSPDALLTGSQGGEGKSSPVGTEALALLLGSRFVSTTEGASSPEEIMQLVGPTVERMMREKEANPEQASLELAQVLQQMDPKFILAHFPKERQEKLGGASAEQLAGELIEDCTVGWAAKKLAEAPEGETLEVEKEVLEVLMRGLQTTQVADRLAEKLAGLLKDFNVPSSSYQRIREELQWSAMGLAERQAELMRIGRYDASQFRRLMDQLKALVAQGRIGPAQALAVHYFESLGPEPGDILAEELSRVPEIISAVAVAPGNLAATVLTRFGQLLLKDSVNEFFHFQVANALATLSRSVARYEDFEMIASIAMKLEESAKRDPAKHLECCSDALQRLLHPTGIERLIEMYFDKRDDSSWTRMAHALLRWVSPAGTDKVLERLETETVAGHRLLLMRLLTRVGASGLEGVLKRLTHENWYVVRNAILILGELDDPQLLEHLEPLLAHPDDRVQQAAASSIIKSRAPKRGLVLARSLPCLRGQVLEQALDELVFLKDPETAELVRRFFEDQDQARSKLAARSLQVLNATFGTPKSNLPM